MIQINENKVTSTEERIVHRLGTNHYGRTITACAGETAECFEELDTVPAEQEMDEAERKTRIEALIRQRYTVSDELGILRQRDTKPDEFAEYNAFVEECKARVDKNDNVKNDNDDEND